MSKSTPTKAIDLEIPLGKRTPKYRFLEMLPGLISYSSLGILVVLSLISPLYASIYLLFILLELLVRAFLIAVDTIRGYISLNGAQKVDWRRRLDDLEDPEESLENCSDVQAKSQFGWERHIKNLRRVQEFTVAPPKPSQLFHLVIVAAYNESIDIIEPTIQSLVATTGDIKNNMIVVFAYEERGGQGIEDTVNILQKRYGKKFNDFIAIKHPKDLPGEVVGKGGNITYAARQAEKLIKKRTIPLEDVIVTTLDCDNKPHKTYFDYVAYEYIVHEDRKRLSYQPIALFMNNIWDVPAPMRVIATGNSFWTIISSMRPHSLRNFASHSQPLDALSEMGYWSKRTIVEDGHQFWRSYFHFNGEYSSTPIYVPIYQDAVLDDTYSKTLKAQFKQLRRWAYGASDVAYVGSHIFSRHRNVPLADSMIKFYELLHGHVTLATISIIVAVGGWVPLLLNPDAAREVSAHQLPDIVSILQRIALLGLILSIFFSLKMLPPRPERYKRSRNIFMVLQWFLMPITAVVYSALSALNAQTHLLFGKYLDKFDVTAKKTANDVKSAKSEKSLK